MKNIFRIMKMGDSKTRKYDAMTSFDRKNWKICVYLFDDECRIRILRSIIICIVDVYGDGFLS